MDVHKKAGSGRNALNSIKNSLQDKTVSIINAKFLDDVAVNAIEIIGKTNAFEWFVIAHKQNVGWQPYWAGQEAALRRLEIVAKLYPDKYVDYLSATSISKWKNRFIGTAHTGKDLLVYYMLQLGKADEAATIVNTLVEEFHKDLLDMEIPEFIDNAILQ